MEISNQILELATEKGFSISKAGNENSEYYHITTSKGNEYCIRFSDHDAICASSKLADLSFTGYNPELNDQELTCQIYLAYRRKGIVAYLDDFFGWETTENNLNYYGHLAILIEASIEYLD